jgi:hypothetical protein
MAERGEAPNDPRLRRALRAVGYKLFRDADDPIVALLLWSLIGGTAIGLLIATKTGHEPFSHELSVAVKIAGAVIVLLGSYFAARTISHNDEDQMATRFAKGVELLDSASTHAQLGGVAILLQVRRRSSRYGEIGKHYPDAVERVLREFAGEDGSGGAAKSYAFEEITRSRAGRAGPRRGASPS